MAKRTSEHSRTVRDEFTRQARSFAAAPVLRAPEVTRRVIEALEPGAPDRILDVACGPGVLAPPLSELAEQVVGVDLTLAALREASAACPRAHFAQGAAEHLPTAGDRFDAAVLRLALHHVEEPEAVLREVRRVLRPGGRLVVLDILTSEDPETAALHNAIERLRDPSHTALLPGPVLGARIGDCGLPLLSATTFETTRDFEEWARIIAEPVRMRALERLLRHLARAGVDAGIDLREEDDVLRFTYRWGLFVAGRPA